MRPQKCGRVYVLIRAQVCIFRPEIRAHLRTGKILGTSISVEIYVVLTENAVSGRPKFCSVTLTIFHLEQPCNAT